MRASRLGVYACPPFGLDLAGQTQYVMADWDLP